MAFRSLLLPAGHNRTGSVPLLIQSCILPGTSINKNVVMPLESWWSEYREAVPLPTTQMGMTVDISCQHRYVTLSSTVENLEIWKWEVLGFMEVHSANSKLMPYCNNDSKLPGPMLCAQAQLMNFSNASHTVNIEIWWQKWKGKRNGECENF